MYVMARDHSPANTRTPLNICQVTQAYLYELLLVFSSANEGVGEMFNLFILCCLLVCLFGGFKMFRVCHFVSTMRGKLWMNIREILSARSSKSIDFSALFTARFKKYWHRQNNLADGLLEVMH